MLGLLPIVVDATVVEELSIAIEDEDVGRAGGIVRARNGLALVSQVREIEALGREGASEMDLAKVKETQKQSRIKAIKENSFWRGQLAARYRENLPLDGIKPEVYQQYIDRLDAAAVQQTAERYFSRENYIQIVLMPESSQIDKGTENK